MDRWFSYPGQIPLTEMFLSAFKNSMINTAMLAEAVMGQSSLAYGLEPTALSNTAVPGQPLCVQIGRGAIFSFQQTDSEAYGILGTDSTDIVKTGINLTPQTLSIAAGAPSTSGQSANYLIVASFSETDTSQMAVPFYNSANPAAPIMQQENTIRKQSVALQVIAGTPANTGSQITPAAPSGTIPLWVVQVNYGDSAVVQAQITEAPNGAFTPPLSTVQKSGAMSWTKSGNYAFTVPPGVTVIKRCEVVGAGGGGGGSAGGGLQYGGSGGGAGGTGRGSFPVQPGQVLSITVGAGGAAGTGSANAGAGGESSVNGIMTATGGFPGFSAVSASISTQGAEGGSASQTGYCTWFESIAGGYGGDGYYNGVLPGDGGSSSQGGGGRAAANSSSAASQNGQAPGSGAGGIYQQPGNGGTGADGRVYLEW